jgi:hypothetical protein
MALEHSKPGAAGLDGKPAKKIRTVSKAAAACSIQHVARELARGFSQRFGSNVVPTECGVRLFRAADRLVDDSR